MLGEKLKPSTTASPGKDEEEKAAKGGRGRGREGRRKNKTESQKARDEEEKARKEAKKKKKRLTTKSSYGLALIFYQQQETNEEEHCSRNSVFPRAIVTTYSDMPGQRHCCVGQLFSGFLQMFVLCVHMKERKRKRLKAYIREEEEEETTYHVRSS